MKPEFVRLGTDFRHKVLMPNGDTVWVRPLSALEIIKLESEVSVGRKTFDITDERHVNRYRQSLIIKKSYLVREDADIEKNESCYFPDNGAVISLTEPMISWLLEQYLIVEELSSPYPKTFDQLTPEEREVEYSRKIEELKKNYPHGRSLFTGELEELLIYQLAKLEAIESLKQSSENKNQNSQLDNT